jgi:hypothetical protein
VGISRVRRRVIVATVVVAALATGGLVAQRLWLTDTARVVDADEAVERFRDLNSTTSSASATPVPSSSVVSVPSSVSVSTAAPAQFSLPEPGVYRYATAGEEGVDVLGGATHVYPAETTITITAEGCGVLLRWDLLQERYEESRLCATPQGIELQATGAFYHEFFQHGQREEMVCDRGVLVVPADRRAGEVVPLACRLNDRPWLPEWQVLGRDVRTVDGVDIQVTHVRLTIADDDEYWERVVADWWLDDRGLPIEMTASKQSKSNSSLIGDVVYHETYTVVLSSLTPLR